MALRPEKISLASRLVAAALGLAAGLLLAEVVLRIARPASLEAGLEDVKPFVVPDPDLGWTGRPNLKTEARLEGVFRNEVVTNSRGLRNREVSEARGGRRRILCLGDSFTWGLGVESADAFPSVLERGLTETEVVNAGVIGWGTAQEWLWLESEGARYAPDVLVLGFFTNDFWDNAGENLRTRRPLFAMKDGALVLEPRPDPELARLGAAGFVGPEERTGAAAAAEWLRVHSWFARAVGLGVRWVKVAFFEPANAAPIEHASLKTKRDRDVPPARDVTRALLGRIRDWCAARGTRLVVLVLPAHEDVSPALEGTPAGRDSRAAYETALGLCRELGLETADARPRLLALERAGTSGFYRGDIHLNPAGHRAAGEALLERLRAAAPVTR